MKLMMITAVSALLMTAAAFADSIPGGAATGCTDPTAFTPVYGKDGTTVLYWNNATCQASTDGPAHVVATEAQLGTDLNGDGQIGG